MRSIAAGLTFKRQCISWRQIINTYLEGRENLGYQSIDKMPTYKNIFINHTSNVLLILHSILHYNRNIISEFKFNFPSLIYMTYFFRFSKNGENIFRYYPSSAVCVYVCMYVCMWFLFILLRALQLWHTVPYVNIFFF